MQMRLSLRTRSVLLLATAVLVLRPAGLAARGRADAGHVLVSAAASLTDAVTTIADEYERETGARVTLNFGPSSGLARQIVNGAPVDLFLSADEAQMNAVGKAGLLRSGTRVDLLSNQLVIVMPADRAHPIASPRALTEASVRRIALADPAAVPAGVYAREYLQALHLWPARRTRPRRSPSWRTCAGRRRGRCSTASGSW